ncbi:MAG: tetratricopeptide repeat-containing diguanylate cyclase [Longicatena sp.]
MEESNYQQFKTDLKDARFQDLEKEKTLCLQLLDDSRKNQDYEGIYIAYVYLLDYSVAKRDNKDCHKYMYEALAHKVEHNKEETSQLYMLCGIYYNMMSDYHTAISYYCQSLHICEEINHYERKAGLLNNIALVFQQCEDYHEALHYYIESYELMTQYATHFLRRNSTIILANIITCYVETHNLTDAKKYLKIMEEVSIYPAMYWGLEAIVFHMQGNDKEALASIEKTMQVLEKESMEAHLMYTIYEDILLLMMTIGTKEQAIHAMKTFASICKIENTEENLFLLKYYIKYTEKFTSEHDLAELYHKYYIVNEECEKRMKKDKADSYRDQLLLDKMMKINSSLQLSATYDSVTSLKNRNSFEQDMKELLNNNNVHTISILMCDIDNFKECNDTLGHLYGDEALHTLGEILIEKADHEIMPYRYGGDEFLCVAINKEDEQIQSYINEIYHALEDTKIEISIGYASMPRIELNTHYKNLLSKADEALYLAKRNGKNRFERKI